jgi:hypothetical protein
MGKRCELYTDYKSLKYIFTWPDLCLRQQRWLPLLKDYYLGMNYHPGEVVMVVDAWSRRSHLSQLVVEIMPFELCKEFDELNLSIVENTGVMKMEVDYTLLQDIRKDQLEDEKILEIEPNIKEEKLPEFMEDDQGVLWYKGRICVPKVKVLKDNILQKAHKSTYSIHQGGNKMYHESQGNLLVARKEERCCRESCHIVALVIESRPIMNDLLGCCNLCKCLSGSGKRLL